jgi:glucose-1-phosphatase
MKQPHFIYFDLGRVLLDFDFSRLYHQMSEVSGVESEKIRQFFAETQIARKMETGHAAEDDFFNLFSDATGARVDRDAFRMAINDIFELNWSILPLVTALKRAGLRIGILSNTFATHWDYIRNRYYGLIEMFEVTVTSFEARSMKPDPEIYQLAVEKAGVAAENLFFTDDLPENIEGACAMGIDAVLFENAAQLTSDLQRRGVRFSL